MMRLCIIEAPNQEGGFISPTLIGTWATLFWKLLPATSSNDLQDYRRFLGNALAHRCQYLEAIAALILHHIDCLEVSRVSALHETVLRYNVHSFVNVTSSLMEGTGRYFYRHDQLAKNIFYSTNKKVAASNWQEALVDKVSSHYGMSSVEANTYKADLSWLWNQRHSVHLDSIAPNQAIDFHEFNRECFARTLKLIKLVLELQMGLIPNNTPLVEVVKLR